MFILILHYFFFFSSVLEKFFCIIHNKNDNFFFSLRNQTQYLLVLFCSLVAGSEDLLLNDVNNTDEYFQNDKVNELISFDNDSQFSANRNIQNQMVNVSNEKQKNS